MNPDELIASLKQLTDRVTELESREAFHEYTVEVLNETVIAQQETIDRLVRISQQLINKMKELPSNDEKPWSIEEEVPPHY